MTLLVDLHQPELARRYATRFLGLANGRLVYDGSRLLPLNSPLFKERRAISAEGAAVVSLVLDERGRLDGEAEIESFGLLTEEQEDDFDALAEAVENAVRALTPRERRDDELVGLLLEHYYDPLYRHSEARHRIDGTIDAADPECAAEEVVRWVESRA